MLDPPPVISKGNAECPMKPPGPRCHRAQTLRRTATYRSTAHTIGTPTTKGAETDGIQYSCFNRRVLDVNHRL